MRLEAISNLRKFPFRPISPCSTTFDNKLETSSYLVQKLHQRDDHEQLTPFRRFLSRLTPIFTLLSIAAYINYFFWRIKATRDEERKDHKIYLLAWLFISAEAMIASKFMAHVLKCIN